MVISLLLIPITIIIILLYYLLWNAYIEYSNEKNKLIQRIKSDLYLIYPNDTTASIRIYAGDASYTFNKNKIYLCLYDQNGKEYPYQTLINVAIHELAHVLCDEYGHTEKFWEINNDLQRKAIETGIIFSSVPRNYCQLF